MQPLQRSNSRVRRDSLRQSVAEGASSSETHRGLPSSAVSGDSVWDDPTIQPLSSRKRTVTFAADDDIVPSVVPDTFSSGEGFEAYEPPRRQPSRTRSISSTAARGILDITATGLSAEGNAATPSRRSSLSGSIGGGHKVTDLGEANRFYDKPRRPDDISVAAEAARIRRRRNSKTYKRKDTRRVTSSEEEESQVSDGSQATGSRDDDQVTDSGEESSYSSGSSASSIDYDRLRYKERSSSVSDFDRHEINRRQSVTGAAGRGPIILPGVFPGIATGPPSRPDNLHLMAIPVPPIPHQRRATRERSRRTEYESTEDHFTINPGLKTAMGSHQGSILKAMNSARKVKRTAVQGRMTAAGTGHATESISEGVITIKKLLSRTTIANELERLENITGDIGGYVPFELSFDEIYLKPCRDSEADNKLEEMLNTAMNLDRTAVPFEKWGSCAVIYLDNCVKAFDVLDDALELQKSNWGDGDDGFIRWATGTEERGRIRSGSLRHRHSVSPTARPRPHKGLVPGDLPENHPHQSKRIPQSFSWEPFGFAHEINVELGNSSKRTKRDTLRVLRRNVRRLMFTFEFLVPFPCGRNGCDEMRKLATGSSSSHLHTFIQRRSVLVQTSSDPSTNRRHDLRGLDDHLCIVADLPVSQANTASKSGPADGTKGAKDDTTSKPFYYSINPAKYRFRPSFGLNDSSRTWYTPALVYFFLKDIIETWEPLVQACIEHVEHRESSVLENPTLDSHTPDLWKDRQHWLLLRSILDAHIATVSRLQWNLNETFDASERIIQEMFEDLLTRIGEVEKKIDKQLKERTDNLVDVVFNFVNAHDAHVSAETGTSMWRLSWITFVFLPLTFLAGIFGMNVASFSNPEKVHIKWYFVSGAIMLVLVIAIIWIMKKRLGLQLIISSARGIRKFLTTHFGRKKSNSVVTDIEAGALDHLLSDSDPELDEKSTGDSLTNDDLERQKERLNANAHDIKQAESTGTEDGKKTEDEDENKDGDESRSEASKDIPDESKLKPHNSARRRRPALRNSRPIKPGSTRMKRERRKQASESSEDSSEEKRQGSSSKGRRGAVSTGGSKNRSRAENSSPSTDTQSDSSTASSDSSRVPGTSRIVMRSRSRERRRKDGLRGSTAGLRAGKSIHSSDSDPELEEIRISGRFQASAPGPRRDKTKKSKKSKDYFAVKSMFPNPKSALELDGTPVLQASKPYFDPDAEFINPGINQGPKEDSILNAGLGQTRPKDATVRIVMLLGFWGYSAMMVWNNGVRTTIIDITTPKLKYDLDAGKEYTDTVRYGVPYSLGQTINGSYPPLVAAYFLVDTPRHMQFLYAIMIHFSSSVRALLAEVSDTDYSQGTNPAVEISLIAEKRMCEAKHIQDLITEFNLNNRLNTRITSLVSDSTILERMSADWLDCGEHQASDNLETSKMRDRYAMIRVNNLLWVFDLNTRRCLNQIPEVPHDDGASADAKEKDVKNTDNRDEEKEDSLSSYRCLNLHYNIESYLDMLTEDLVGEYDSSHNVLLEISPNLSRSESTRRIAFSQNAVRSWKDALMEEFDWMIEGDTEAEPDTDAQPVSPTGHDEEEASRVSSATLQGIRNSYDIPGLRILGASEERTVVLYMDAGFSTTKKILTITAENLVNEVRLLVTGNYDPNLETLPDRKTRLEEAKGREGQEDVISDTTPERETPLVLFVGNLGDDLTDQPLPPKMWNRIKRELQGEAELRMLRGQDLLAHVIGLDVIENAQNRMVFDISNGKLWEYPPVQTL